MKNTLFRCTGKDLLWLGGFAAVYGLLCLLLHSLMPSYGNIFYLAEGAALAALLIGGRKYGFAVFSGALLGSLLSGTALWPALIMAAGVALGAWLGTWLIRRDAGFDATLPSMRDLLRVYALGGAAGALLCALCVALVHSSPLLNALADVWMAASLGVVLLTPLLLKCWPCPSQPFSLPKLKVLGETLIILALTALLGAMVFLDVFWNAIPLHLHDTLRGYLMFFFITLSAIRLGARATSFAVLLVAILGIAGALRSLGYFASDLDFDHLSSYWLYVFTLALVGMVLSLHIEATQAALLKLANSESSLSLELKHISAAIDHHALVAITDLQGRILHVNDSYFALCGYSREELVGQNFSILKSGVHDKEFWRQMYQTIAGGNIWHGEICNKNKNGSLYWVQSTISPFLGSDGKPSLYVTLRTDITERKHFEKELQSQRDFFERISETLGEGLYVQDEQGLCTYLNNEAERLLGWSRAEFIGKQVHDTIHYLCATGEALASTDCVIIQQNSSGVRVSNREQVFVRRDGTVFAVSVVSQGLFQKGVYSGAVVSFQDISASKRSDLELKMYREHLVELVQQKTADLHSSMLQTKRTLAQLNHQKFVLDQHAIVTIADAKGRITYGNDKFCKTSGYGREEFLGKDHRMLNSGVHAKEFFRNMYQTLERGEVWRAEVCNRTKDGSLFWLDTTIVSFLDESGELLERIAVRTNITARKLAQDAAFAASRAKSEFLANLSHEIRTPMNGVVGMVDIMQQTQLTPEQHRMLNTIQASSLALLHILNDILDFSKIEAGKLAIESVPTRLRDVAEDVAVLMATMASSKRVDLFLFVSPQLPNWIAADPVRLRQILFNLLGNAVKFTASDESRAGRVSLHIEPCSLADGSPGIAMRISDNGIGMNPQTQVKLFQPFSQADESTARKFGGSGLGLSISRRLASLMGGQIAVQSALGEGSEFTLTLPLQEAKIRHMPVFEPSLEGVHVLFVSHDPVVSQIVADYCRAAGARITLLPEPSSVYGLLETAQGQAVVLLDVDIGAFDVPVGLLRLVRHNKVAVEFTVNARPLLYLDLIRGLAIACGRLPSAGVQYRSPQKLSAALAVPGNLLLLLAEDNETNREVMQEQLRMLGYAVEMAEDGVVALAMWKSGRYALLLTDCHMPNMDGFELTAAIRKAEAGGVRMPIIAVTANAMHGESGRCLACGMDDYLAKPLRLKELEVMLQKWLSVTLVAVEELRQAESPLPVEEVLATDAIWDTEVMTRLLGDKPAMISRMLDKFLLSSEGQVAAIGAAIVSGETRLIADTAHKLKSGARTVGAMQLGELCQNLETLGEAGDARACSAQLAALNAAFAAAAEAIKAKIH